MELVKYDASETHIQAICALLDTHGLPYLPTLKDLPQNGYIALYRGEPMGAGFLRKVEGNFGQIDGLITNKDAPSDLRHSALELIVPNLINLSKNIGITRLMCFTRDTGTLMRSASYGFVCHSAHSVISLEV